MVLLNRGQNLCIAFHQRHDRAVFVALRNGPRFGAVAGDAPTARVAFQHQVDKAQMAAPEAAHGGGLAVDRARAHIHAGIVRIAARGEDEVAVPGHDGVDPVNGGEGDGSVLHHVFFFGGPNARMRQGDDDIGACLFHLRHPSAGGL